MNKEFIEKLKEILETKTDSEFEEIDELESKRFNTIERSKMFVKMFVKFNSNFKDEKIAKELIKKYNPIYRIIDEKLLELSDSDISFGSSDIIQELRDLVTPVEIHEFIDLFKKIYKSDDNKIMETIEKLNKKDKDEKEKQ